MGLFKKKGAKEAEAPHRQAPPAGDPNLPGTAGYRVRQSSDVMPHRFTFVRPDGKREEPRVKKSWWHWTR